MDKQFALIIAEMLIKQDETTAQVKNVSERVIDVSERVINVSERVIDVGIYAKGISEQIGETNSILKEFMGVSVKQWEQQQIFNELMISELREIKGVLSTLALLDTRLKAVEERESKFENRLANIERLLKAS